MQTCSSSMGDSWCPCTQPTIWHKGNALPVFSIIRNISFRRAADLQDMYEFVVKWAERNALISVSPQGLRNYLMVRKCHRTKKSREGSKLTFRKRLKRTEVSTGAPIATKFPTKTQETTLVVCTRGSYSLGGSMKNSSVAPRLKQEKQDDCKFQEGDLNSLELRLGISSDNCPSGDAASPWLGVGVHPWSLASRQAKSALELEQAYHRPNECAVQRENRPAASAQLVGWPPVRAFRKNLSTPKTADAEDPSKVKLCSDEGHGSIDATQERRPLSTMFVKVNLEGYAVGRKIDLKAHRSYDSLSRALQSMFHGFLSDGIATRDDEQQQQLEKGTKKKRYVLVYEDNEGDRMLVGDVPWELFIASVKRLYIAQDPRTPAKLRQ
ncbi:auxin-responsive protein IAA25-like [Oryza brachyantha]|uniref:auxin-responsive protein IAA25-like n=1 Tax=Oryza brachyantha TaxID=4533 RepID=UPI0003EAC2B6|nr:auxin-responsive protein IAA25-like [Oryza brachyantha]XP_015696155.1 auxin-responsive protein IAA25-like [Oryza brachyantha]XP_040382663.1 auxin-responsive protein IAA25-like [Oryza brachyantha]XP_040382664.1 auxin-responsive protein IAA25-like [Oryza brachyantha]